MAEVLMSKRCWFWLIVKVTDGSIEMSKVLMAKMWWFWLMGKLTDCSDEMSKAVDSDDVKCLFLLKSWL